MESIGVRHFHTRIPSYKSIKYTSLLRVSAIFSNDENHTKANPLCQKSSETYIELSLFLDNVLSLSQIYCSFLVMERHFYKGQHNIFDSQMAHKINETE